MKLLIFPYNGNGLEALDCIGKNIEFLGFVDDTIEKHGINEYGNKVFGREAFEMFPDAFILAVPGSPTSFRIRGKIIDGLHLKNERFINLIHKSACVSPLAKLGVNIMIMAGVVITSNAVINNNVCILPNSVVHHDTSIGEYTLVGSNVTIAGNTTVGRNCYIGSGSSIINGITIGDETLVGMGSNVIKSLPKGVKVVGNPARII